MKPIPKYYAILLALTIFVGGFFVWSKIPLKSNSASGVKHVPKQTTLFLAGDIMLSRNVATEIYKSNEIDLPYKNLETKIASADISFANLESPFSSHGPYNSQGLTFNADPNSVEGLKIAGFDILSTANNHAFDQGKAGVLYTIDWLNQNKIIPLGTGASCHDGAVIVKNNIKFGFLGYSYTALNDNGTTNPLVCDSNDLDQLALDVKALRPKVDFLITSNHMGIEYTRNPTDAQTNFAHTSIDSGADFVVGHHPHWIQTSEQYKGKWIFYSLGNFVFDQMWSQDTREGLTLQLIFKDKYLDKIELKPVVIDNFCCPRWADDTETKSIFLKSNLTSTIQIPHN